MQRENTSLPMKSEENLQIAISSYLKYQYPDVIFTSESSGIRLTIGQATKAKKQRSKHKLPDMIILYANLPYFAGICFELKKESPFLKDGSLSKSKHIQEQNKTLELLESMGYISMFIWKFEQAKTIIDKYLNF